MKVKVFMRNIRESFTNILDKYHYKGMIMPLFLMVFLFNGITNANFVPVNNTKNSLVSRITTAISDKKQAAEKTAKLEKSKIASLPETAPKATYVSRNTGNTATTTLSVAKTSPTPASNTINIAGRSLPIYGVGSTSVDSGSFVAHYGNYLYYGHRSTVFGFLAGLPAGTEFTINYGGTTATYRIANTVTLDNSTTDASGTTEAGRYMSALVNGNFRGGHYDAVLMTCAGTAGGGVSGQAGDAEARTVVLASRV